MSVPQQVLLVGLAPEVGGAVSAQLGGEASCRALPRPPRPTEPLGYRPAAALVGVGSDSAASFAFVARLAG